LILDSPADLNQSRSAVRALGAAEADAELAAFQLWLGETAAAEARADRALKNNPRSGLANETMGFVRFREGRDDEALKYFDRALDSNRSLHLSAYYRAMMPPRDPAARRAELNRVIETNPDFAPAHLQIARTFIEERNFTAALSSALKARQLAPSRAGYHSLIAEVLHALGRDAEAAVIERYVDSIGSSKSSPVTGARVVRGTVSSAMCRDRDRSMTIVVDGMPLTLRTQNSFTISLSDLVWYGSEHFDRCRRLNGTQVLIEYLPSRGELLRLEIYK
jgi:uncharacterized protein HemY